jgi:hypothetical protein
VGGQATSPAPTQERVAVQLASPPELIEQFSALQDVEKVSKPDVWKFSVVKLKPKKPGRAIELSVTCTMCHAVLGTSNTSRTGKEHLITEWVTMAEGVKYVQDKGTHAARGKSRCRKVSTSGPLQVAVVAVRLLSMHATPVQASPTGRCGAACALKPATDWLSPVPTTLSALRCTRRPFQRRTLSYLRGGLSRRGCVSRATAVS